MQLKEDIALVVSDLTPHPAQARGRSTAILAAALALPGICANVGAAEPPSSNMVGVKYLHYRDQQPGLKRTTVNSPSVVFLAPIAEAWSIEGGYVTDNVSGASPRYHTAISGASRMEDKRSAFDLKATTYFADASLSISTAQSTENDYKSRATAIHGSLSSEDRNATVLAGIGVADDEMNPVNNIVAGETRRTKEFMVGAIRVLTAHDVVQLTLNHSEGHGYYSDPYKLLDLRPRSRRQTGLIGKWNHYVSGTDAALRLSYGHSQDSFEIRSHTFTVEYAQPFALGWMVTPSLRLYRQTAASFYVGPQYDALFGEPFPPGFMPGSTKLISQDQRLGAFHDHTIGMTIAKQFGSGWSGDVKVSLLKQTGDSGIDPLTARWIQVGLYRRW